MKKIASLILFILTFFLLHETLPPTTKLPFSEDAFMRIIQNFTPAPAITPPPNHAVAKVVRVVDGDTIEISGNQTVRYIGMDTPEPRGEKGAECYAKEATNRNKELVLGKTILLEKDVSEKDSFGRILRYVYLIDETKNDKKGEMVNQMLVNEGYATVVTYPPDVKYADLLLGTQTKAREEKRGLWRECRTL